jgi:hypothetical protein
MEHYIKNNVDDITYMSELTPTVLFRFEKQNETVGVNSPKQLTFTLFRKLWAH